MSPDVVYAAIPILAVAIGCPTLVLLGVLAFPSTRAAFARRLGGRTVGEMDDRAMAHLASTDANVTALRSELYALRCEVAAISRALPPGPQAPTESRVASGGR